MNILEFKMRSNVHQTHFEDLILLGNDGIEEMNDKIEKFISSFDTDLPDGLVSTVKVDGCLHPDTLIKTTDGDIPISSLILNNTKQYIGFGFDENTKQVKEITLNFPRVNNGDNVWYNILLENGSNIIATENHLFKVKDEYLRVDELKPDDDLVELN